MLIPLKIKDYIEIQDIEIENSNFKSLNLREELIEGFLRKNIEVIFQDETLLVGGKQVANKENGRSELTAVDQNGNLVFSNQRMSTVLPFSGMDSDPMARVLPRAC